MTVPGMADGRALGLAPYLSSSQMTSAFQTQHRLASAHALREKLQQAPADVMRPDSQRVS
jgi:hypothetical protein